MTAKTVEDRESSGDGGGARGGSGGEREGGLTSANGGGPRLLHKRDIAAAGVVSAAAVARKGGRGDGAVGGRGGEPTTSKNLFPRRAAGGDTWEGEVAKVRRGEGRDEGEAEEEDAAAGVVVRASHVSSVSGWEQVWPLHRRTGSGSSGSGSVRGGGGGGGGRRRSPPSSPLSPSSPAGRKPREEDRQASVEVERETTVKRIGAGGGVQRARGSAGKEGGTLPGGKDGREEEEAEEPHRDEGKEKEEQEGERPAPSAIGREQQEVTKILVLLQ